MATIREGNKPALLIVDMQVDVMNSAWKKDLVIENIRRAVDKARVSSSPVI